MTWVLLALAIIAETIGTTALQASKGFSNFTFSAVTIASYVVAFYLLAIVLKTMPVGVAYAIWSGAGVALITIIGFVVFHQKLDFAAIAGIGLIVAGVIVLNVFSGSTSH